jgi:hypothetical protein
MIRDRIQSQIVERQPWDIRAHCPYCRDLEKVYGPDYEQVIAIKFKHPTRRRLTYPPGTLIDAIDLDFYIQHLLKGNKSKTIVIEFMTAEAAERRDEVDDLLDDLLANADLGGVAGSGSMPSPEPGMPFCDLQLEVYNKQKALALVRRVLKQSALHDVTRIVIPD